MKNILFLMEKLGFEEKFEEGMCFGCATMASQAFVLGPQAYNRYQIRLNRIESLVDQYTKLPTLKHPANSSKVDRLNLEEARFKEIIKDLPPPPINYLDQGENEWVSMRAYLESVAIAQQPQYFNRKYKIFQNQFINNINPLHFNKIAELIQSQSAEERGGFSQVGNFSGIYSVEEMQTLLNSWEQFMQEQKQSRSALIISNRIHTFMLGYDADDKSWIIDDSSIVTKYQSGLAKDIFLHVPLVEAGEIISLSDSEEKIIISTMVCCPNLSHSEMAQLFADKKWKSLHEVSLEKAKFQNKIGDSWLNLAAQHNHVELVKELITAGSDVNLSVDNMTPLFFAAQNGNSEIVKVLIEAKADINASPFEGCTPLYIAAQNGHEVIVKDLINAGANINISAEGYTPLCIAKQKGHIEIVKELEKAAANIDKLSQELTSETKKLTVNKKKDSLSKPELKPEPKSELKSEPKSEPKLESKLERQKQLEELLKAPPKSQKTEFNKNSSNAMSTQSRYSFLQTKLQDEKDKDKKKKGEVKLCI